MSNGYRLGTVVTALALGLAACGKDEPKQSPDTSAKGARELAAARAAGRLVYYLGDEYDGLKLMSLFDHDGTVTVTYGRCQLSNDSEPACAQPVQVHTSPLPPKDVPWTGCVRHPAVRGVASTDYGGKRVVYPGDIAVEVFTDTQRQAEAALAQLQTITGSVPVQADLPTTSAGTLALLDQKCGRT